MSDITLKEACAGRHGEPQAKQSSLDCRDATCPAMAESPGSRWEYREPSAPNAPEYGRGRARQPQDTRPMICAVAISSSSRARLARPLTAYGSSVAFSE